MNPFLSILLKIKIYPWPDRFFDSFFWWTEWVLLVNSYFMRAVWSVYVFCLAFSCSAFMNSFIASCCFLFSWVTEFHFIEPSQPFLFSSFLISGVGSRTPFDSRYVRIIFMSSIRSSNLSFPIASPSHFISCSDRLFRIPIIAPLPIGCITPDCDSMPVPLIIWSSFLSSFFGSWVRFIDSTLVLQSTFVIHFIFMYAKHCSYGSFILLISDKVEPFSAADTPSIVTIDIVPIITHSAILFII